MKLESDLLLNLHNSFYIFNGTFLILTSLVRVFLGELIPSSTVSAFPNNFIIPHFFLMSSDHT